MADHRVCPWWLGYLLASPIRRIWHDPAAILGSRVRSGMTVFEPGPGMGFFTLELARRVGASGRVVVVDIQPKMLNALQGRLAKAGLLERVDARLARPDSMGLTGLDGAVDFALVFAVVHELPSADAFFSETSRALKPGATLLLAEPYGHVTSAEFDAELATAAKSGLAAVEYPSIRRTRSAVLRKA